jgi:hypothetical protein
MIDLGLLKEEIDILTVDEVKRYTGLKFSNIFVEKRYIETTYSKTNNGIITKEIDLSFEEYFKKVNFVKNFQEQNLKITPFYIPCGGDTGINCGEPPATEIKSSDSTSYKIITTTGSYNKTTNKIFVRVTLEWTILPETR